MSNLPNDALSMIGSATTPCILYDPFGFFGNIQSVPYFRWKGGYFTLGKEDTESFVFLTIADGGSVTDDSGNQLSNTWSTQKGGTVTLHINPNEGYEISQVMLDGKDVTAEVVANNGVLTIENVQGDINLSVSFSKIPIFLTIDDGSLNSNLRLVVEEGKSYQWEITPKNGNEVKTVLFNGTDVTSQLSDKGIYTTTAITANSTLSIEYKNKRANSLDVNADNTVNVTDAMIIVDYILGKQ